MHKFDIEVEGNHNYFVDGVMVHNSPETTTGGNALKFYASVRLDIRRTGSICSAIQTVPMPPSPIWCSSLYRPNRVPACSEFC